MASLGQTPGLIIAAGVGAAASVALEPAFEVPKQNAWANLPHRILDPATLARLAAQGGVALGKAGDSKDPNAYGEALRQGYSSDKLDRLIYLAQTVPGVPEALHLWRHGFITDAQWTHALVKAAIDPQYYPALNALKTAELIGLGDIAAAIVRGAVPTPSWVPVGPPTGGTTIPRYPVAQVDPVLLAAELGFSEEMLQIMTARSGLSLAPVMAAQAYFRKLITLEDAHLAAAEGDLRTEWMDTVIGTARQILTADQYMERALRGWTDLPTATAQAAQHGMSAADALALYEIRRRPMTVGNITKALARGGTFQPGPGEITDPYSASVHQADLGPEWYSLAESMKYTYPSAFVLRSLTQDGDISQLESKQILLNEGWEPGLAETVSTKWAGGTGAATSPDVKKAHTQLWGKTYDAYIKTEIDETQARANLNHLGIIGADQDEVITTWSIIRTMTRQQLSAADIRKALQHGVTNPNTGQAWTRQQALDALVARGYDLSDANTYIDT